MSTPRNNSTNPGQNASPAQPSAPNTALPSEPADIPSQIPPAPGHSVAAAVHTPQRRDNAAAAAPASPPPAPRPYRFRDADSLQMPSPWPTSPTLANVDSLPRSSPRMPEVQIARVHGGWVLKEGLRSALAAHRRRERRS
ncbi:hypothetical protein CGRA01v4_05830 [Colletotrichum graminicola]|uniref:Uncharacterized protein n=1 Tax=Colletotrichum graminicola (strain M1.001 / M2 / FGSC 10212) TaxID=645133 RepID=E3QNQ3_COLGM|nr:uncharacterized protein GLRG_07680 [Colletotrichum graminicola M1.001]EFQ32410.1 hypothetical protein GLRG_07680 [Colletotrichum graminicola M1.001]WDK14549.1 hypothetical protein CGRA01v4_05830 [Colletotrichum graminicola]